MTGKARILLLEDNDIFRRDVVTEIEERLPQKVEVVEANSFESGLEIVRESSDFHLIIVDLKLSGSKSGLDFLSELKDSGIMQSTPKLVVSDLSRENISLSGMAISHEMLIRVGMTEYLEKREFWHLDGRIFDRTIQDLLSGQPRVGSSSQIPMYNSHSQSVRVKRLAFEAGGAISIVAMIGSLISALIENNAATGSFLFLFIVGATLIAVSMRGELNG